MSGPASITMAADSTQGEPHEDAKKKKKNKHKKYKKHKKRDSSSDSSVDSDLDLDKEMHPISHYVKDRDVLVQQLFRSITTAKLRAMLPEVLKPYSIEELRSFCLEQLEVMSKKRILRILQGEDPENISSSSTEDETDEEKEKTQEKKEGTPPPSAEAVTSASVSEAEGTADSAAVSEAEEGEEEEVEEVEVEEEVEEDEDEEEEEEVEEVEEIEVEEEVEDGEEVEEVIEEVEVEDEGTEEEVEYEEVEIEVTEDEEEEGECESEEEEETVPHEDVRKVEIKAKVPLKSLKSKPTSENPSVPELQLHADQGDFDEMESEATSLEKSRKAKLAVAVKQLQVTTSDVKPVQIPLATSDTQKRRVKLKRDGLPGQPAAPVASKSSQNETKSSEPKRIVKATKRKSSDGDPLSLELGPSTSEQGATGDIVLSKNQMEILELEMRARAIKAMLKMHSN